MNAHTLAASTVLALLLSATGCAETIESSDEPSVSGGGLSLVTQGKDDNYYSDVAREFEMSGRLPVKLSEEAQQDDVLRNSEIQLRLTAVGLYLTAYLTAKFEGIDINNNGTIEESEVFFRNADYGGFQAMVRNYSIETEDVEVLDAESVSVAFTIDVGGPPDLLGQLLENGGTIVDSSVQIDLRMPAGATSDPESVARREIRNFNPDSHPGELESVTLSVVELDAIADAYPQYAAFMADGVYDITMFFGHDYNTPRADLREAQESFEYLLYGGFEPPVPTYDELDAQSGPFKKTVIFRGREVTVEVRLFHGDMFTSNRPLHKQTAIDELIARDVFFYNGHAGPYYGLYLDAAHAADVSYLEIAGLAMPDKQQLFVAQGCQTYSQYADMLYANPAKSEDNLDAITTVNYSYGSGTLTLLDNLLGVSTDMDWTSSKFEPRAFYEIITDLNEQYLNESEQVFYGVMGLDGNPQTHPEANLDRIGTECTQHGECGTTTDANLCLGGGDGVSRCAARTLGDRCPRNTRYAHVATGETIIGGICY